MLPTSTFEIIIEEDILYFKDVWAYMDSGMVGDVISCDDQLEQEWEDGFENYTTKCDDNMWISYKVPYIKHKFDGIEKMQRMSELNFDYVDRVRYKREKLERAKQKLRKKQKEKVIKLGTQQYHNNILYRMKVNAMLNYAIMAKFLMGGYMLHSRFLPFKVGLYLNCYALSIVIEARHVELSSASLI